MLSIEEMKKLIKLIDESSLDEFEYEAEGTKLRLQKNKPVAVEASQFVPVSMPQTQSVISTSEETNETKISAPETSNDNLAVITSPMVGTFYASATPDEPAFVSIGSAVSKETVVCIVEAMKLFNEITADISGEIAEILVTNGELVEFGQPLFKVKKSKE